MQSGRCIKAPCNSIVITYSSGTLREPSVIDHNTQSRLLYFWRTISKFSRLLLSIINTSKDRAHVVALRLNQELSRITAWVADASQCARSSFSVNSNFSGNIIETQEIFRVTLTKYSNSKVTLWKQWPFPGILLNTPLMTGKSFLENQNWVQDDLSNRLLIDVAQRHFSQKSIRLIN